MVLSIASTSAFVCGVNIGLAVLTVSVVFRRIHQFIELRLIVDLNFGKPTASVGFGVQQLGSVGEDLIDFEDFTADREDHFRRGFDGFDRRQAVSDAYLIIRIDGEFYENDVGEGILRIVGNTNCGNTVFNF